MENFLLGMQSKMLFCHKAQDKQIKQILIQINLEKSIGKN
jgi:hypothetical protein